MFGLSDKVIKKMQQVFETNSKIDKAFVFGSRAKGNYKEGSDIDIAIKGQEVNHEDILSLLRKLDELDLIYEIDLINYNRINEPALKEHIDRVGVEFYSRWKKYKLGDVVEINKKTIDKTYKHNVIEYLDTGSITQNKIEGFQMFNLADAPSRAKRLVQKNDIIYSTVRPIQRHYGFIENSNENMVVSTGFAVVSTIKEKADAKFLYYLLSTDDLVNFLDSIADGSTSAYPSLRPDDLATLDISMPPLPEQTAIASILSSLDDKIDLLLRQNKTLEQLAETLFRQWFVVEADESWEVGNLDDVISVKGGTTPSTVKPEYWNGNINWTSPRDLSNATSIFLFKTEKKITEKGLSQIGSGLLPIGTVLLSSRAPIGYLTITEIPVAINQGYIAIVCDKIVSNYFVFLWCKANMGTIENAGNGSVFQEISKTSFKGLEIVIPSREKLNKFDDEIEPVFQKIKSNQTQIRTLTQTRDTLLPKLMSGEVRVKMSEHY